MIKKSYTQEDAELLASFYNWINRANLSANISKDIKKEFNKIDNIRIKLHQKITEKSNWSFHLNNTNKKIVIGWSNK